MNKISLLTITIAFLCWENAIGQEKIADREYSRVSLTVIYIDDPSPDPNGGLSSSIRSFVENTKLIGPKFPSLTVHFCNDFIYRAL